MRNMLLLFPLLWLLAGRNIIPLYLLCLLFWLMAGCGMVDRVAIENRRREAVNLLIHSEAAKSLSWANCLEAYASPRLARQEKTATLPCGLPPPTVISFSWKDGEKPTVQLLPPLNPFAFIGGVLGGTQ